MFNSSNQNRLSIAEQADYYKSVLETERVTREQADKEIIDILHDVKSRYDYKIKTHMANKQGDKKTQENNKKKKNNKNSGKSVEVCQDDKSGKQDATDEVANNDDWGNPTSTSNADTWGDTAAPANEDSWGNTAAPANNDSWGDAEPKKDSKQSAQNGVVTNDGWGDTAATNNDDNWGDTSAPANDDNWGDSEPKQDAKSGTQNNVAANDDWGTTTAATNDDSWGDPKPKQDTKQDNKQNAKQSPKQGGAKQSPKQGNKQEAKQAPKEPAKQDIKQDAKQGAKPSPKQGNKQEAKQDTQNDVAKNDEKVSEIKSQLWTAKLDLRLMERDKIKLTEELASVKAERDELIKKYGNIQQEQDTMKVKVRGLTVDLLAANDEIHKLNERIDELEAERRNRDRDVNMSETKRRSIESKSKNYQQQIAELCSELSLVKEEKDEYCKRASELGKRNERLENDLCHSKNLIRTLKDGCALVEDQARTFEIRHDTVVMSKADLERELVAIKEESSRHITTINKLQKSNEQISKAFILSVEAHDSCKKELEVLQLEYNRKLDGLQVENLRLIEANNQLRKLIDYMQKKR